MKKFNVFILRTLTIMILCGFSFASNVYAQQSNSKQITMVKEKALMYFLYQDTITSETYAEVWIDPNADESHGISELIKINSVIKFKNQKFPVTVVGGMSNNYSKEFVKEVILPTSIKKIGPHAFNNMEKLTTVKYDYKNGQLETIGFLAFSNCKSLVVAPYATEECKGNTLKKIGNSAFVDCSSLKSFSFPSSIDSLGSCAFSNCTSLSIVNFPKQCSLKTLESSCFENCPSLRQIIIPEGVTAVEDYCFRTSGVTEVWFPGTLTSIGDGVFHNCNNLEKTHFKYGFKLERLGEKCFCNCTNLKTVDDSDGCASTVSPKYIGEMAFAGCKKLISANFVSYCDSIGENAFYNCSSLKEISTPSTSIIGKSAFARCHSIKEASVYSKYIGEEAFYECTALEKVFLGDHVEYIGEKAFKCSSVYGPSSLQYVYGLRPDIEYGAPLYAIFSYVSTNESYRDYGCYYAPIERSFQYNVLTKVKPAIKEWEKKKDYEKTSQWAERLTEENRDKELKRLMAVVKEEFIEKYAPKTPKYRIGNYDADAEVYTFTMEDCKSNVYVTVPSSEVAVFKENFGKATFAPEYCIKEDKVDLARCAVTVNGKTYTSPTLYEDDSTAAASINLPPLEINIPSTKPKNNIAAAPAKKSDVDTNIPTTNIKSNKVFVVIIGNEDYSDKSISSASFAQNDANIFEQYCLNTFGIPQKNIHKKLNATRNQIRSEIKWLTGIEDAFGTEAEIIFYYSGHGMPDEKTQKTYLLPSDGMANDPESGYAITTLYAQLGELNVNRVLIFLDACFSGSQRNGGMLTASRGVAVKVKADAPSGNTIVFSAASGDETAYPNSEEEHGMFTYYLLKKLQETKGQVTMYSLGEYIITNVRQQSIILNGKSQTPNVTTAAALGNDWKNWKLK